MKKFIGIVLTLFILPKISFGSDEGKYKMIAHPDANRQAIWVMNTKTGEVKYCYLPKGHGNSKEKKLVCSIEPSQTF
ncbi:hypothetical protein N9V16_02755 [SAR116 cluster bacterium]|nr:hypothetical protein [SAR116 cluster bacterium]